MSYPRFPDEEPDFHDPDFEHHYEPVGCSFCGVETHDREVCPHVPMSLRGPHYEIKRKGDR